MLTLTFWLARGWAISSPPTKKQRDVANLTLDLLTDPWGASPGTSDQPYGRQDETWFSLETQCNAGQQGRDFEPHCCPMRPQAGCVSVPVPLRKNLTAKTTHMHKVKVIVENRR